MTEKEPAVTGRTRRRTRLHTALFLAVLVAVMPACTWKALRTGTIGANIYVDRILFSGMERGTPVVLAIEAVRGSKDAFWMRKRADLAYEGWIWREGGMKPLVSKQWTKRAEPGELVCPHDEFIFARSMEDRVTFTLDNEAIEVHLTTEAFYDDFQADSQPGYGGAGVAAAELTLDGRRIKGYALSERIHKNTEISVLGTPHRVVVEPRGTTVFLWEREGNTWLVRAAEDSDTEEGTLRHRGDLFHRDPFDRLSQMKNAVVEKGGTGWMIEADFGSWKAALKPVSAVAEGAESGAESGPYRNVMGSVESDGSKWEVFGVVRVPAPGPPRDDPSSGSEE